MTGQDVYIKALALLDDLEPDGTASDETNDSYAGKAPMLIDLLQRDLCEAEGIEPPDITSLNDELVVSDKSANVMVYGLAAKFAKTDSLPEADFYQYEYDKRLSKIGTIEEDYVDNMNVMDGFR